MNYLKYFFPITLVLAALVISNKSNQSVTAHPFINTQVPENTRVSFNQQVVYSLAAANRAQQAHYFELAKFAKDSKELGKSGFYLPENENYQLVMESKNSSAFIYGIAEQNYGTYKQWSGSGWQDAKEPLYSYVSGITYTKDNGAFQTILCASKTVGKQKLAKPKIADRRFTCPDDTEKIR